ncbi:MAG: hypothetical protein ABSH08_20695 [Tepidisphaeraceae bacterium]
MSPVAAPPAAASDANPPSSGGGIITGAIYRLQMPFGANSRDDSFWKLLDEDVVDVPTNLNLNRNGLRVGRGWVADWPEYLKLLIAESAIKIEEIDYAAGWSFEDALQPMSGVLPEELLFIYDDHGLTMRSFDDCQNLLSLKFQWVPRKPGTIRLTICPVIEAWRTRRDYSLSDDPPEAKYLERLNYYDLHFRADVAPGEFLALGTSTATEDPNRVGSRFLTRDGPNQRYEQVLILVGQSVPMKGMKNRAAAPATTQSAKGS